MTITSDDRNRYHTTVSGFHVQPEPDSCFPTALKNILDELADRKGESNLRHSISDLAEALDYVKNRAATSDHLATRIDPLLEEAGWEVNHMTGVAYDQLQTIIESDDRSLPLCELHEQYFEDIRQHTDSYTPEPGLDGFGRWKHIVIPFKINDNTVLYFDPYIQFFHNDNLDDINEYGAMNVPIQAFNEWWSRPEKRWALWLEPSKQQTLSAAFGGE